MRSRTRLEKARVVYHPGKLLECHTTRSLNQRPQDPYQCLQRCDGIGYLYAKLVCLSGDDSVPGTPSSPSLEVHAFGHALAASARSLAQGAYVGASAFGIPYYFCRPRREVFSAGGPQTRRFLRVCAGAPAIPLCYEVKCPSFVYVVRT